MLYAVFCTKTHTSANPLIPNPTHRNTSPKCQDAWRFQIQPLQLQLLTATPGSSCLLVSTCGCCAVKSLARFRCVSARGRSNNHSTVDHSTTVEYYFSYMGQSVVGSPCIRQYVYIRKISDWQIPFMSCHGHKEEIGRKECLLRTFSGARTRRKKRNRRT